MITGRSHESPKNNIRSLCASFGPHSPSRRHPRNPCQLFIIKVILFLFLQKSKYFYFHTILNWFPPKQNFCIRHCRAAKLKMKLEWMDDGRVKTTVGPLPGIKYDEMRQRKIWFNSMATSYTSCGNRFNDPKKMVCFGDGSPLPEDIMHDYLNFMEEECVDVPWQKGDILMLDNLAVLHSRKPFTPPRRILAALCK